LQLLEVGRLNNVDVRQDVTVGGRKLDLAVATQRDDNSVMLFTIDADGVVTPAGAFPPAWTTSTACACTARPMADSKPSSTTRTAASCNTASKARPTP
jgi:myo-inositol-hexaphosphate 3-phosphohydrolase